MPLRRYRALQRFGGCGRCRFALNLLELGLYPFLRYQLLHHHRLLKYLTARCNCHGSEPRNVTTATSGPTDAGARIYIIRRDSLELELEHPQTNLHGAKRNAVHTKPPQSSNAALLEVHCQTMPKSTVTRARPRTPRLGTPGFLPPRKSRLGPAESVGGSRQPASPSTNWAACKSGSLDLNEARMTSPKGPTTCHTDLPCRPARGRAEPWNPLET